MNGSLRVVGEFLSLAEARSAAIESDAILIANKAAEPRPDFEEPLTPREIEVLELLAQGLPNKAIAARLGISDQTVKFHVSSISGKLGAANRTDTVRRAVRRGLITL
jgi:DNA-binding NarL/FixJ family response regulator